MPELALEPLLITVETGQGCCIRVRKVCHGVHAEKTKREESSSNGSTIEGLAGSLHNMTSTVIVSTAQTPSISLSFLP